MKKAFYRRSKIGPQTAYKLGLGRLIGKVVLLLTTTGRKTGLARVTPVQYELIDGVYHIGAVFGVKNRLGEKYPGTPVRPGAGQGSMLFRQSRIDYQPRRDCRFH